MRPSTHQNVYIPTMWHKSTWSRRLISTYIYQQCDTSLHGAVDSSVRIYTNNVTQIYMGPSTHQYVYIPTMWHTSALGRRLISTYIYQQCDTNLHGAVDSSVRIYTNNVTQICMWPSTHQYVYIPTMWHESTWGRRLISTYIYQQCDTNLHAAVDSSVRIYTNNVTQIYMGPSTHQYVYIPTMWHKSACGRRLIRTYIYINMGPSTHGTYIYQQCVRHINLSKLRWNISL